jgi:hypothetical protein
MRRISLLLLPFLAAFALVFGLYYLYAAFRVFQDGHVVSGAMLCLFGIMGIGLAAGIWIARRRALMPGQRPPA